MRELSAPSVTRLRQLVLDHVEAYGTITPARLDELNPGKEPGTNAAALRKMARAGLLAICGSEATGRQGPRMPVYGRPVATPVTPFDLYTQRILQCAK